MSEANDRLRDGGEPVLIEVTRGALIESRHRGSFVLLCAADVDAADADADAVAFSCGEVHSPVFGRSSLKPMQAAAMVAAGFAGPTASIALAAASHDGADVHLAGVRAILAAAGLDESALQCPPDLPGGREALVSYLTGGRVAARVCHNCSGKHAAMLATCVLNGWDARTYLAPEHPLQVSISARIEQLCSTRIVATSVDGCGAPAYAFSLTGLAHGFAALATAAHGSAESTVAAAMRANPRLVGGSGRAVSELLAEVDGLVCKDGAEGVWAAGLPDGRAFAAKLADGSARALPPLLAAALRYWGYDGPVVRRWAAVPILGGGLPVGTVTWSARFRELLGL